MAYSGMLRRVALVGTDVSEDRISSIIRVTRIGSAIRSSETAILTRATQYNIQEDCILRSNRREHQISYSFPIEEVTHRHIRGLSHVVFLRSELRLLVTANVPSSAILVTLMMEAIRSSETAIHTRATRYSIPEDCILRSNRREHQKSYIVFLMKKLLIDIYEGSLT
jgi:hypothetical protein